jgi:hypothetical protein
MKRLVRTAEPHAAKCGDLPLRGGDQVRAPLAFANSYQARFGVALTTRVPLASLESERMLRVVHNRFFSRAVAALLALVACGGALNWGHVGGDDRDCDTVAVYHHDHTAHRVSTAALNSSSPNDHCYICHSLRLLHQAVTRRYERVAGTLAAVHRPPVDIIAVRDGSRIGIASRAPPAVRL